MKEGQATWIVGEKREGNITSFKEALRRGDTKCGSSCWLVPLVKLFSFLVLS